MPESRYKPVVVHEDGDTFADARAVAMLTGRSLSTVRGLQPDRRTRDGRKLYRVKAVRQALANKPRRNRAGTQ